MGFFSKKLFFAVVFSFFLFDFCIFANEYVCPDLNGDNEVDFGDYAKLSEEWLFEGPCLAGDIVSDGIVDYRDLEYFSRKWLENVSCTVPISRLYMTDSIAKLKFVVPQHYDMAVVAGYYSPNDGGGGTFIYDSNSTLPDDGAVAITPRYMGGRWLRKIEKNINVKDFGAKGDGAADDTNRIQSAVSYAYRNGNKAVYMPPGVYKVSNTIYMTDNEASDSAPSLIGAGVSATEINLSDGFPNGNPAVDFYGAGQSFCHAEISGLLIRGHGYAGVYNEVGIRLRGVRGVRISECMFDYLRYGVRFHNTDSGAATEFNIVKNSHFSLVGTSLHFYRTGGNSSWSFRGDGACGSGLAHSTGDAPVYYVEDISGQAENALLYHAPFDTATFGGSGRVIFKSNVNQSHIAYGSMRIEGTDSIIGGGNGILHLDDYLCNLGEIIPGSFRAKGILGRYVNGRTVEWQSPSMWSKNLQSGTTVVDGGVMDDLISMFFVEIKAVNYDYRYLVLGTHSPGTLNIISTIKTYNGNAAGAPSFSIDSLGRLNITNINYSSAYTATVYEVPLGSYQYPIQNIN